MSLNHSLQYRAIAPAIQGQVEVQQLPEDPTNSSWHNKKSDKDGFLFEHWINCGLPQYKLFDDQKQQLSDLKMHVQVDKGFTYSDADAAWVYYRKNHFQLGARLEVVQSQKCLPRYVLDTNGEYLPIAKFTVDLQAIHHRQPNNKIELFLASSDRDKTKKKNPTPIDINLATNSRAVFERLHLATATQNNARVNNMANPLQRYFNLLVILQVTTQTEPAISFPVMYMVSDSLIVRGGNPGRFLPYGQQEISSPLQSFHDDKDASQEDMFERSQERSYRHFINFQYDQTYPNQHHLKQSAFPATAYTPSAVRGTLHHHLQPGIEQSYFSPTYTGPQTSESIQQYGRSMSTGSQPVSILHDDYAAYNAEVRPLQLSAYADQSHRCLNQTTRKEMPIQGLSYNSRAAHDDSDLAKTTVTSLRIDNPMNALLEACALAARSSNNSSHSSISESDDRDLIHNYANMIRRLSSMRANGFQWQMDLLSNEEHVLSKDMLESMTGDEKLLWPYFLKFVEFSKILAESSSKENRNAFHIGSQRKCGYSRMADSVKRARSEELIYPREKLIVDNR